MWTDYFKLAFRTFAHQKKRTVLTLLGIFIGIAAVVSLISLGQGLKVSIDRQFELLGADKIFIRPGTSGGFNVAQTIKLTDEDVETARSTQGVKEVSGSIYKLSQVKYGRQTKYTWVVGIDNSEQSFEKTMEGFGTHVIEGRGVRSDSEACMPHRFRIGDFFDRQVEIGDRISIEGKKFKFVCGVSEVGNPQDDSNIYITLDAAKDLFDATDEDLDFIFVTVKPNVDPGDVAERLKKRLRKTRDVKEGNEDFTVQTTEDFMATFGIALTIVQIVLVGIATISLLVGGVNIANTMYTAVMERTREIGIMKAVGARNSDVFLLFLIESGILGVVGGIAGIAAGLGLSKLVAFAAASAGWTFIQTVFPWYLTFGALLFSFAVGAIAGTLPARQASRLKPVDALRYE